jgi:hypothetical protein
MLTFLGSLPSKFKERSHNRRYAEHVVAAVQGAIWDEHGARGRVEMQRTCDSELELLQDTTALLIKLDECFVRRSLSHAERQGLSLQEFKLDSEFVELLEEFRRRAHAIAESLDPPRRDQVAPDPSRA